MASKARLYLVDGSSQMYRAYHAIRGLTGPDGKSTNAVYGFVTMLRKLVADTSPHYIAAAFDLAGPTFRSDLAADYKANRSPMPPDLGEQIPFVHEACRALGVPTLTVERYEADDVIGTLARRAVESGFDVAIVTGDKDFFQLVDEHVTVYNPRDEGTWYDAAGVKERFGVEPSQVVDVLALMGDSIDNVKGVPGIGEKGARELIATHGSLEALLLAAPSLTQKKYREALMAHADDARRSRELVKIHTDVALDLDFETFRYQGATRAKAFDLFSRLGFRTLVFEYAPTADAIDTDYAVIETPVALDALVSEIRAAGRVAVHGIASDGPTLQAALVGLAFSTAPRRARYVPLHAALPPAMSLLDMSPAAATLSRADALVRLRPLLEDAAIVKSAHDLKVLTLQLGRAGITLAGTGDDAMLASYVLDATRSNHDIEGLALEHAGYKAKTSEELRGKGVKALPLDTLSDTLVGNFAGERADLSGQLATLLVEQVDREHLTAVYRDLELPLIPVLADIERAGVRIDQPALSALAGRVDAELARRSTRIYSLAGVEFNINSPRQLAEVLFEKLQLPASKKTGKTRATSTAVEVLEELALGHEIPREILEWRALAKLKGTYIDALPALVNPETGRVHTSFNQAVAATGRLSSSDPNLQNIPIRTGLGREIRGAFVAAPGAVLISADYSQIELRVLAHLSRDESLIDAFARGDDIHDRTAEKVFGADSVIDPYELRRRAKIVNYALLYGKTAFTLAKDIGVTQQAAQEFIDAYFAGFPGVRRFIDETLVRARETGVVTTMFGRRRLVPDLTNRNQQVRGAAERIAVNMPIQGSAADILKRAMIDLHDRLARCPRRDGIAPRMILTVHDELLFEVPAADSAELAALVKNRMESAVDLAVPLTVDVGVGANWKDAKS